VYELNTSTKTLLITGKPHSIAIANNDMHIAPWLVVDYKSEQ